MNRQLSTVDILVVNRYMEKMLNILRYQRNASKTLHCESLALVKRAVIKETGKNCFLVGIQNSHYRTSVEVPHQTGNGIQPQHS